MWLLFTALAAPLPLERCEASGRLGALDRAAARESLRASIVDPSGGLVELDRLTAAWPRCDALWMARAGVLHTLGRDADALVSLRRAEAVATGPEARRALAVALHHQGAGGAVLLAAAEEGEDPLLALLAAREAPLSERGAVLQEAVRRFPDHEGLALETVDTLRRAGRPREAVTFGRAWLEGHESERLAVLVAAVDAPFSGEKEQRPLRPAEFRQLADGTEEVVVYSSGRAKRALVERLDVLGYTAAETVDGGVRYRSERPVTPYVDVFDDGRVEVQEKGRVKPAPLPDPSQQMIPSISARKLRPDRIRVMEAIALETATWQQALTMERFQSQIDEVLPDQMTALWEHGTPLYGDGLLVTTAERRDALIAHWASRACSAEGDAVRGIVERFLRNVVQESPVALGPEAREAAERRSMCPDRRLRLE